MKKFNPLSSIYFYAGAKGRSAVLNLIAAAETRVSSEATRSKTPTAVVPSNKAIPDRTNV